MSSVETETESVRYHPLDVSRLVKGQVLTVMELEPILGLAYPDERWGFRLLRLRAKIEAQRRRLGLPIFTIRSRHGALIVCDDPDASVYNRSMGKRGIRRFKRASGRNLAVDVSKLSDDERKAHERTVMRQAMMLTAIRGATHKQPTIAAPQRTTPAMVAGPAEN